MFSSRPISFRRILLSRFLLLSVPVLLLGVYVTYRKARSSFLEMARQNVQETAQRQSDRLHDKLSSFQANLVMASSSTVLQEPGKYQALLMQLQDKLPKNIQCLQLSSISSQQRLASTCNSRFLSVPKPFSTPTHTQILMTGVELADSPGLSLVITAPVNDTDGRQAYYLSAQVDLVTEADQEIKKDIGTAVIDQEGNILAHPLPGLVGANIQQQADRDRLKIVVRNALTGENKFAHLFAFQEPGRELLAGYSAMPSPVSPNQQWVILALLPMDRALAGLVEIQQILLGFTLALLSAIIVAAIYIARELAQPLEKIRDYALHHHQKDDLKLEDNFHIQEYNQLAQVLAGMVNRLTTWGAELESAWHEATTANQLKSEFLATTSHELRTPLNQIIGCLRIIQDGLCDDEEEKQELLAKADQAALNLLSLINDLLDFAKIESGKLDVEIAPVDVGLVLEEVISQYRSAIDQKGLRLIVPLSWEPVIVRSDRHKLQQVFANILDNAVKFTDKGSITISLHLSKLNSENNVVITIQDTGIGISPHDQNKIFHPFVMVDGSSTRSFGGTGLGLAIARNLMEMMGGKIALSSRGKGEGTTVELMLTQMETSRLVY